MPAPPPAPVATPAAAAKALPPAPAPSGPCAGSAACVGSWWAVGLVAVRVVTSVQAFVTRVLELRGAGLSAKAAFVLLQAFSRGHITHLLRANYEGAGWTRQFDDALVVGLEQLTGQAFGESHRAQCFLRLSEGGLGLGSAEQAAAAAFLGSWGLVLKEVAGTLGAVTSA